MKLTMWLCVCEMDMSSPKLCPRTSPPEYSTEACSSPYLLKDQCPRFLKLFWGGCPIMHGGEMSRGNLSRGDVRGEHVRGYVPQPCMCIASLKLCDR